MRSPHGNVRKRSGLADCHYWQSSKPVKPLKEKQRSGLFLLELFNTFLNWVMILLWKMFALKPQQILAARKLTKVIVTMFIGRLSSLFNCRLWSLDMHWPHELTNFNDKCRLCLPHKMFHQSLLSGLPCALWLSCRDWFLTILMLFVILWCQYPSGYFVSWQSVGYRNILRVAFSPLPFLFTVLLWKVSKLFLLREAWEGNHSSYFGQIQQLLSRHGHQWC